MRAGDDDDGDDNDDDDDDDDDDANPQAKALKSALWYAIGRTVDSEMLRLGSSRDSDTNATPQFIGALTELVWGHAGAAFSFSSSSCQVYFHQHIRLQNSTHPHLI